MQTNFSELQLQDPDTAVANQVLRSCVHCGLCTATCPTFQLLGDELDGPRGRIYLIKDMLETNRPATEEVVRHVDRCLSCLSCMTTCPSGVHYMHLVDHARAYIERTYRRPVPERLIRGAAWLDHSAAEGVPYRTGRCEAGPSVGQAHSRSEHVWRSACGPCWRWHRPTCRDPIRMAEPRVHQAEGPRKARVALLAGCAQRVIAPGHQRCNDPAADAAWL